MNTLRWLRVPGDTRFALGAVALVLFVLKVVRGRPMRQTVQEPWPTEAPSGADTCSPA
jgi:hypothetical protein